jgi:hypothetical protein
MTTNRRFNKFGLFGREQRMKRESVGSNFSSFATSTLEVLETAKMQLTELDAMKNEMPKYKIKQFRNLKNAFQRQNGCLSEGQLRWLQYLYDECFKSRKENKIEIHLTKELLAKISHFVKKVKI